MAGRGRKWFISGALFAAVAALVWASLNRRGMEVQLKFVGYTNYVGSFTNLVPGGPTFTRNVFSALVLATNSGGVEVDLDITLRTATTVWPISTTREWQDNMAVPIRMDPSRILKPGETALVEVEIQKLGVPWSFELLAKRREIRDRLFDKVIAKGGARVQGWVGKWLSPPLEVWATLKMTNAPLDKDSLRECIEPYRPRQVVR